MYFTDRFEAGKLLSQKLLQYRGRPDVIVLALPRGGVPVAYEVAKALDAPLDVFLVRKLGLPGHEELAMGAVADGDIVVFNEHVTASFDIPEALIKPVIQRERRELHRQRELYRDGEPPPQLKDRIVILVDDGLATGSTVRAAIAALRKQELKRLVVAVPVGASDTCAELRAEADEVVCGMIPRQFVAVGLWYQDFSATSDDTVRALLHEASHNQLARSGNEWQ
jgi:putative phosphoribosyl transferase